MRKRFKIPLWMLTSLLVLVIAAFIWLTQTRWLESRLVGEINRALQNRTTVRVQIGDLTGTLLTGARAEAIVITDEPPGRIDTLATIDGLTIDYDIGDLAHKRWRFQKVVIERPRITLPASWAVPTIPLPIPISGGAAPLLAMTDFDLDTVVIIDGQMRRAADSVPTVDSINLTLAVHRSGPRLHVRVLPSTVHVPQLGIVSYTGDARFEGADVTIDSMRVRTERSEILIAGTPAEWRVTTSPFDLEDARGLSGLALRGRIAFDGLVRPSATSATWSLDGVATGTLEGFDLDSVRVRLLFDRSGIVFDSIGGFISDAAWHGRGEVRWATPGHWSFQGTVRNFDLERYVARTYRTDLSGAVSLDGFGLRGLDLRIRADVDLGPGVFDRYRFQRASGSLAARADSLVVGEGFILEVNGTRFEGDGAIAFADSLDLYANVFCPDLSVWDPFVFVDSLAGEASGYIYLTGRTKDPDVEGAIQANPFRVFNLSTDDFGGRFALSRFLTHASGPVFARWGRSTAWGVATDSIFLQGDVDGHSARAVRAAWYNPRVNVEGAGLVDWSQRQIPLTLFPLNVRWDNQTYTAQDTVRLAIDSSGFNFATLAVTGPWGSLDARGRFDFDTEMDLEFDVEKFRAEVLWSRFFPRIDLRGMARAKGHLLGRFSEPRFSLEGRIADLNVDEHIFGDLNGRLVYESEQLRIEQLRLDNPDFRMEAAGTFPIDIRFDSISAHILPQPLSGTLQADGTNLDRIVWLWPKNIESIRGDFHLAATVGGTPQSPRFSGEGSFRNGTIKTLEIVNPLETVDIDLALRQDTIVITRAAAVVRDGDDRGDISGRGQVRILSYNRYAYDLALTGRDVPTRFEFEDYAVNSDFDLTVTGDTPPGVSGAVSPRRVDDREPFSAPDLSPPADTTVWDWDYAVTMPGNYWIHNDQMEAELSADLRVLRHRGKIGYVGTAEFIRGKVYLLDKIGRIKRGTLTFDDPERPDPSLDIDVVFRIQQPRVETAAQTVAQSSQVVDLALHVGGRASEPLIQPEAPYTEQDVLLLLTANTTLASDSGAAVDPWASRLRFAATGLLLSEVQQLAARKLGLETLEISSGVDPLTTEITVGRYFSPQLYLYGTSPIDVAGGQDVGFEYRLSRHMFFAGNRDRDNLYRLNLNLHWDY